MSTQNAEDDRTCVICMGSRLEGLELFPAPCGIHFVCRDDIVDFFRQAVEQESMYPPACCDEVFQHRDYEQFLPLLLSIQYRLKQTGEYSVLPKCATTEPTNRYFCIPGQAYLTWLFRDRIYCAIPTCSKFLHPRGYITNSNVTYAHCICTHNTCTKCKSTLTDPATHICTENPDTTQFKNLAAAKGYKTCPHCSAVVELREACNHIAYVSASGMYSHFYPLTCLFGTIYLTVLKRCTCGTEFCYICGSRWPGLHGCPAYGRPRWDTEGYNQDGFHRETGRNREGLTRQQAMAQHAIGADELDWDDAEINHIINGPGDLNGFNGMLWRLAVGEDIFLEAEEEEVEEREEEDEEEDDDDDDEDEDEDDDNADDADDADDEDDGDDGDEDGGGEGLTLEDLETGWGAVEWGDEGEDGEGGEGMMGMMGYDDDDEDEEEEDEEEEGYEEQFREEEDMWEDVDDGDAMEVDDGGETNHAPDIFAHERLIREWAGQDREI